MVNNLEEDLSQSALVQQMIEVGYTGLFDFVYMPMNFRGHGNFGYAFVNFKTHAIAARLMKDMQQDSSSSNSLKWIVMWSTCQGLSANVKRYRNSPLMNEDVHQECKPAMYDRESVRVAFPKPTKPLPKHRVHGKTPKEMDKSGSSRGGETENDVESERHRQEMEALIREIGGGNTGATGKSERQAERSTHRIPR